MDSYGYIELTGMKFHAYHGCLEKERTEGNTFIVDFMAEVEIKKAIKTDDLTKTVNYAAIYDIVAEQMKTPSNLLEHVAGRIVKAIEDNDFPTMIAFCIKVSKKNPPVNGEAEWSSVIVTSGDFEVSCLRR